MAKKPKPEPKPVKELILVDEGLTDQELLAEIEGIPKTELFNLEPHGAEGEVVLDGQFTRRELLLLALWLERKEQSRPIRK